MAFSLFLWRQFSNDDHESMNKSDLLILLSVAIGGLLLIWNNKRHFNRLNQFGVEQFTNYRQKVGARLLDALMLGGGYGLLVAAGVIFAIEYAQPFLSLLCLLSVIWMIHTIHMTSKK